MYWARITANFIMISSGKEKKFIELNGLVNKEKRQILWPHVMLTTMRKSSATHPCGTEQQPCLKPLALDILNEYKFFFFFSQVINSSESEKPMKAELTSPDQSQYI